ncbi:MAG: tyrosine-type recombinase/integrase, partial [bacterium]|nr:tyrosine-type recombinase/integrase [bacterium]
SFEASTSFSLLYGTRMRIMEILRLRVRDLDFERREITIRDGKGHKDRRTMLPAVVVDDLRTNLRRVRKLHQEDLARGYGRVYLPYAPERKYPNAEDDRVHSQNKDYSDASQSKTTSLVAPEFSRRYLLHVLPPGFHRIRYSGLFANRWRTANLERCRALATRRPASQSRAAGRRRR